MCLEQLWDRVRGDTCFWFLCLVMCVYRNICGRHFYWSRLFCLCIMQTGRTGGIVQRLDWLHSHRARGSKFGFFMVHTFVCVSFFFFKRTKQLQHTNWLQQAVNVTSCGSVAACKIFCGFRGYFDKRNGMEGCFEITVVTTCYSPN